MELAKTVSLCVTLLIFLLLAINRRWLIGFSCASVFFLSNMLFVGAGVVLSPWVIDSAYINASYSWIRFEVISESDVIRALLIFLAASLCFISGHYFARHCLEGKVSKVDLSGAHLLAGIGSRWNLRAALLLAAAASVAMLSSEAAAVLQGMTALLRGDIAEWLLARARIGELGRPFAVVMNALLFLSIALWLQHKQSGRRGEMLWAVFAVAFSLTILFLTFQRRPLVVFLGAILFANWFHGALSRRAETRWLSGAPRMSLSPTLVRKGLLVVAILFAVVALFYRLTTTEMPIGTLLALALDRLIGRLSIMALMYTHYFPAVEPHYGLSNVGALASVFGTDLYNDTVVVLRYFSAIFSDEGSGAISAFYDLYGAFGVPGVLFVPFLMGVASNFLDGWLRSMRGTCLNMTLWVSMLIFAFYLSQASIARAISTYGGAVFVLLWWAMRLRLDTRIRAVPNAR